MFGFLRLFEIGDTQVSPPEDIPDRIANLKFEAIVDEVIRADFEWRVKYKGCFWHARSANASNSFNPGEIVHVVDQQGCILLIQSR